MSAAIEVSHLSYSYPGDEETPAKPALRDVSFSVEEGSFVAILGHNGSGKSTLAKLLCMVLEPDEGEIVLHGRRVTGEDVSEDDIFEARRDVGMVFQNPDNQIVATVVEEDVAFGCENLGIPSDEIRRRVDEALALVGMTEYARSQPHQLSGGQKQRIAIAGIIAMRRRCVIFDESTAMLDPIGRQEVMRTIRRLNREEGLTVLLITHYMNEAAEADRVLVMDHGRLLTEGTPREVFSRAELLWGASLDVPQATEVLYKLKKNGAELDADAYDIEETADRIAAALGKTAGAGEAETCQ